MFYRISCITSSGEIRGYQWRPLDLDLFESIARGQRPLGDADAQQRDSTELDSQGQNRTMYYGHVWHNGWITDLDQPSAQALYAVAGYEKAGA